MSNSRNTLLLLLQAGWKYARQYRTALIGYTCMFIVAQAIALLEPYIIGKMLNSVQINIQEHNSANKLWHDLCFYLGIFFSLKFVFWIFHGPSRVIEKVVAFNIKANYKEHLFSMVTAMPMQWHKDHHSGESIDKINRASNSLFQFYEGSFGPIYMSFRFFGALAILFLFTVSGGLLALSITIATIIVVFLFDRYLFGQYKQLNSFENKVATAIHDYVTNIGSIITLRLETRVLIEIKKRLLKGLSLFTFSSSIHELKYFCSNMLIATLVVSVLLWYVHCELIAGHIILAGTIFTLFEYLRNIGDSFFDFTRIWSDFVEQTANLESAQTIIQEFDNLSEPAIGHLPSNWQTINISDLHFRYEDQEHHEHHLDDITICLERKKKIAFIGASGSGKSTLLSLLRGLHNTDKGELFCDGNIMHNKLRHLLDITTLIPQEPEIFADTIRFNITFGLEAQENDILEAIDMACFTPILERLPFGLETSIAEKGVNLSGGEKQRLALARGLFFAKDSDILLLDEPTSSVDTLNERLIYTNMFERYSDKCIVSSLHKMYLLNSFDYIYLLDRGKIIEQGQFNDLLELNGTFAQMYQAYQLTNDTKNI